MEKRRDKEDGAMLIITALGTRKEWMRGEDWLRLEDIWGREAPSPDKSPCMGRGLLPRTVGRGPLAHRRQAHSQQSPGDHRVAPRCEVAWEGATTAAVTAGARAGWGLWVWAWVWA